MSETSLNINIKANEAAANASIRALETTVKGLSQTLAELGNYAANASTVAAAAINRETEAIKAKIAALGQEIAAIQQTTSAGRAAARAEAEYLNRDIDLIKAKQRTEAEYINASMDARERQVRQAIALNNARVQAERQAEEANARAEAEYLNRNIDLVQARSAAEARTKSTGERTEATYINRDQDLALARARAEAEYLNRDMDLAYIRMRQEADLMNAAFDRAKIAAAEAATASSGGGFGNFMQREIRHFVAIPDAAMRGQRGQVFASIGAAARDAGLGVAALSTSMVGLVALLSTGAILRGADNIGKWATELRANAAAVGMTVEEYSSLQAVLTSTGMKADDADSALRRLGVSLSTALADPASKQAEAFHNLGIAQDALAKNGTNVSGALRLLANAFAATANDANKTANMNEILGRGFETLIPAIQGGAESFDRIVARQKEFGRVIDEETALKLEKLGDRVRELSERVEGEGIRAFVSWGSTIEGFVGILESLSRVLGGIVGAIGQVVSAIDQFPTNIPVIKDILPFGAPVSPAETNRVMAERAAANQTSSGAKTSVPALTAPTSALSLMRQQMEEAARTEAQGATTAGLTAQQARENEAKAEIDVMQWTLRSAKLTAEQKIQVQTELAAKQTQLSNEMLADASRGQATAPETMRQQMAQAGAAAAQSAKTASQARMAEAQAEIGVMQKTLAEAKLTNAQRTQIETELAEKQKALRNETLSAGATAAKQSYEDFAAGEKLKISEAQGSSQKIIAIYNEWIAAATNMYRQHNSVIIALQREEVQEVTKAKLQELQASEQSYTQNQKLLQLNRELSSIATGKMVYAGQEKQLGPSADIQQSKQDIEQAEQVAASAQQAISARQQLLASVQQGSDIEKQLQQEIMQITIQAKEQEIELYKKAGAAAVDAANKTAAAFVNFFNSIGSQFETFSNSLVKALLAPQIDILHQGLTSIKVSMQGNEIRSAFTNMLVSSVQDAAKSVESALSKVLANALSGGSANTLGELLGNWLSKGFSSITGIGASAATSAVGNSALVSAIAASATTTTTGVTGAITAAASTQVAAITTAATGIIGAITTAGTTEDALLAALNVKPSALGFAYAGGGIVPSAAGGMVAGGFGASLAVLHAREMVLPAHISEGIQSMIRGGNINNSANLNYSATVNTAPRRRGGTGMTRSEFSNALASHSGAMFGEARNMIRNGWRPA